jgi:tRNA A-37 threonylcarbamoyl transferase component Bud32
VTEPWGDAVGGNGSRSGQVMLGKYRVERLLGRGGMGEVYEARHTVVGRRFAIKFLKPGLTQGQDAHARFLREAQAAGALDNEHIAAVVDFDVAADGAPFLVMEYLNGESLAVTLRREGVLPVRRVIGILLQVCDGLSAAHAAGIVHRDLKPDNLFLVARSELGTPLYMAPEQARGEKSVDFRVDVHALGVIAYELLSGQRPHPGDGYNAILAHILTRPVRPLRELCPELPPALLRAVERALAFEPSARHESVAALAAELLPLAGREVAARGAQFDLRGPQQATPGDVTLATADLQPPAEGTLQSAVGDARSLASSSVGPRRHWWLLGVVAAAAAVWLLGRGHATPSAVPADTAARLPGVVAASEARPTARGAPIEPPTNAPPAPSGSSAVVVVKAKPPADAPKSKGRGAPPRHPPDEARTPEVSFDEKNPY